MVTVGTQVIVAMKRILLDKKAPTVSVYMICMAMYGSGVQIGMEIIRAVSKQTLLGRPAEASVFFAAAVGSAIRRSAARRFAPGTSPAARTTTAGFGLCCLLSWTDF